MKFLFINSFYPPRHYGGADIQVYQLANKLAERGYECHVVCDVDASFWKNKNESNAIYPNHANVHFHGLKSNIKSLFKYITKIPTESLFAYVTGYNLLGLDSFIKKNNFDVIHYHNLSYIGQNVIQYGNAIKLYTEHTNWLVCPRGTIMPDCNHKCTLCALKSSKGIQLWRYTNMLNNNLKELDMIIAPSKHVYDITSSIVDYSKIHVIPNFAEKPPTKIDNQYNDFNYFLYVGALEKHKGIIKLITFFKNNRHMIKQSLFIVGSGREEKLIETLNDDKITSFGQLHSRTNLYDLYANAQALIIPSIGAENAPLVALEAMSVGTPIIVSDVGGLPEIANKIDPKLVYHNDSELLDLLYDFDKSKYSDKAKQVYEQNYTIDRYVEQYLKLIDMLVK